MSDANIPVMLKNVEEVFQATRSVVEAMQPGERKQIKELAQTVSSMLAKEPKEVINLITLFAHNTNIAYVTRGKNGGVVRGTRPAKTVKVGKKNQVVDTTANDSPDTSK